MKKSNLLILLILFSACSYKVNYIATYDIQNKKGNFNSKDVSVKLVNRLADKYKIQKDEKYNRTDTLEYFSNPYHYFRFVINNRDSILTSIKFDYYGKSSNKKNSPYSELFISLTDSIESNFILKKKVVQSNVHSSILNIKIKQK